MQDFSRYRVLQLIDTLALGGAERVAVNIANALSQRGAKSFLCATRDGGPLEKELNDGVLLLRLDRKSTFDISAIFRLRSFISDNQISIIHAHSSSLFIAVIMKILSPGVKLIWHDHNGNPDERNSFFYKLAARFVSQAICVNQKLVAWMTEALGIQSTKIRYIPNFAAPLEGVQEELELPGAKGLRVVSVANIRWQKGHKDLVAAFDFVATRFPEAHLILVGDNPDRELLDEVCALITRKGLEEKISILGRREDVGAILSQCDIGVISSLSEGLPLALLEYGFAGLAVVSTHVGQCREVLADGEMGRVVPRGDAEKLGEAIAELLEDSNLREELGRKLRDHVQKIYSEDAFMKALSELYETV